MKLTGIEARSIVYEDDSDWRLVESSIVDTTRWSIVTEAIHKHLPSGKFYRFSYSEGATECQDERAYQYDNTVEPVEVHQVEVLMKVWEDVN